MKHLTYLLLALPLLLAGANPPGEFIPCFSAIAIPGLTVHASCNGGSDGSFSASISMPANSGCGCGTTSVTKLECRVVNANDAVVSTMTVQPTPPANIVFPVTVAFTGLPAGTFKLKLTAFANGTSNPCDMEETISNVVTIEQPTPIVASTVSSTPVSCPGNADGKVQVKATGGTPPYTFSLPTGQSFNNVASNDTKEFTNLSAGVYTLTVTDSEGCMKTHQLTVTSGGNPFFVQMQITKPTCFGGNDGKIEFTSVTGGGGTSYSFNNGSSSTISGLTAGQTLVTIVAFPSNCDTTLTFDIGQTPAIELNVSTEDASCHGANDGSASLGVSGGNGGYLIEWSNGESSTFLDDLAPGTYAVTVTDSKGCTAESDGHDITEPGVLEFQHQSNSPVRSGELSEVQLFSVEDISHFEWEITRAANIAGGITGQDGMTPNNGSITQIFSVEGERATGEVTYSVRPVFSPACKGDSMEITVAVLPLDSSGMFIPEVFTPNADGQNDVWKVVLPEGSEGGRVTVFNRSGGKVFEGASGIEWDAAGCPDGTYFYVIRFDRNGQEVVRKGAVTLLTRTN